MEVLENSDFYRWQEHLNLSTEPQVQKINQAC